MTRIENVVRRCMELKVSKGDLFCYLGNKMSEDGWDDAFGILEPALQQEFREWMMPVVVDDVEVVAAEVGEVFSQEVRAMLRREFKERGWT